MSWVIQSQVASQSAPQSVERPAGDVPLVGAKQQEVAGLGAHARGKLLQQGGVEILGDWRSEFIDQLKSRPPTYILVVDDVTRPWYVNHPREDLENFSEFYAFFQACYRHETRIGQFDVYRLDSLPRQHLLPLATIFMKNPG